MNGLQSSTNALAFPFDCFSLSTGACPSDHQGSKILPASHYILIPCTTNRIKRNEAAYSDCRRFAEELYVNFARHAINAAMIGSALQHLLSGAQAGIILRVAIQAGFEKMRMEL